MRNLNYVRIPDGRYSIIRDGRTFSLELQSFFVLESLVTIEEYLEWYYEMGLENHVGGTYRYFNDVNSTNSVHHDLKTNTYTIKNGFQNSPMRGVNWAGAMEFAKSYGGRLPTELEWEICARSGHENYTFPWGDEAPNSELVNYGNHIGFPTISYKHYRNEWGLYDMAGNLREWCLDYYHPQHPFSSNYPEQEFKSLFRTIKGGAWDKTTNYLRCSFSEGKWERIGTMSIGFRVVKNNKPESMKGGRWNE